MFAASSSPKRTKSSWFGTLFVLRSLLFCTALLSLTLLILPTPRFSHLPSFYPTPYALAYPSRAFSQMHFVPPPPSLPPVCHVVGHDPNNRRSFNTRPLCITSAICLRPNTQVSLGDLFIAADRRLATCTIDNPDFSPVNSPTPLNCTHVQSQQVFCAHGRYAGHAAPQHCPRVQRLSHMSLIDKNSATWLAPDRVAVVVPAFPWLKNVFHFAMVAGHLAHTLSTLPILLSRRPFSASNAGPTRLTVIFHGVPPWHLGDWQAGLTSSLLHRLSAVTGIHDVTIQSLHENAHISTLQPGQSRAGILCAHTAVMLGAYAAVNQWPFANSSAISIAGDSVPLQAVVIRQAVYDQVGIRHVRLPSLTNLVHSLPARRAVFGLPPLVIGYAHRGGGEKSTSGKTLLSGWRRFSEADEQWLVDMLHVEAARVGGEFREIEAKEETPFAEQVRMFAGVGFVVGIHGANLANCIFVPPFGALLEITPGGHSGPAYIAGMNSGLAYFVHEAEKASAEESLCRRELSCWPRSQQRRVKIEGTRQRRDLRTKVRFGLDHLGRLHEKFPYGIPANLQLPEQTFQIQ